MASLVLGFVPLASQGVAQGTTELASYAPAGALMYGEVELEPDSRRMTLAHELLDRASLEALFSPDQQHELDEGLAIAEGMIDGQAAFFFGPVEPGNLRIDDSSSEASSIPNDPLATAQDLPSGWAILLQPSDAQAVYDFLLDSLGSSTGVAIEHPGDLTSATPGVSSTVQTESYEGYRISYVAETGAADGRALALVDEIVVVATTTDDVKTVIDVFAGTTPPLADDPTFQATPAALPNEYTSLAYMNVQAILPLVELAMSSLATTSSTEDAVPACGEYASQDEARAAYDEDDFEIFMLDLDWDGQACEDYFASAFPAATPVGVAEVNVLSLGSVTWS